MKKLTTFVLLVLVCLAAQGQTPNAQFRQLEDYLDKKGLDVVHTQFSEGENLSHQWAVCISAMSLKLQLGMRIGGNEDLYARQQLIDSINALRQQEFVEVLDSIRHTFSRVSKDAAESYLYEVHKNGADTIKYSLSVAKDPYSLFVSGKDSCDEKSYVDIREIMGFRYQSKASVANGMGFGFLTHVFNYDSGLSWDDMKDFDNMAFEQLIQPVLKRAMKLKGAKEYPVYWRHDKGFDDDVTEGGGLIRKEVSSVFDNPGGLTTGVDYVIPLQHDDAAHALLRELDSLSHGYVDAHPEQLYRYNFPTQCFPAIDGTILKGYNLDGTDKYILMCELDPEGFHILYLRTNGEFWMPRDWQKLKSYINGEKVYRKK